ncbi:MAG: SUMF1/EgtB/PvdO family nonheme iron enzyme [Bacteroidales bacterium]
MRIFFSLLTALVMLQACAPAGGDLGRTARSSWRDVKPLGMVLVKRGSCMMGSDNDSIIGETNAPKEVSVESFWMDESEVTNHMYHQFVNWVRDSIFREELGEEYLEKDRMGNYRRPIPWRKADMMEPIYEKYYKRDPMTGTLMLRGELINYTYRWYDRDAAALMANQISPRKRVLNTDITVPDRVIFYEKDTVVMDDEGQWIQQSIRVPVIDESSFIHMRIVNVYPDTTVWVNDYPNAKNTTLMQTYFSHPAYQNHPVVGVTWEQATAYCNWRTDRTEKTSRVWMQYTPYRLPTEAEWVFAASGRKTVKTKFPWHSDELRDGKECFYANFQPGPGNYTEDGYLTPSQRGAYKANELGLHDMPGNVSEWTSTAYTASGDIGESNFNPQREFNALTSDPYYLKRKVVRGGSFKDATNFMRIEVRQGEYQNQPRSFIGFRCVRTKLGEN